MMKNKYSNIINKYVKTIKKNLLDDLNMILVIGSSCSDKVIKNWSDIDVILVINDYNFNIIEKIKKISNSFEVKIGTTIYTKKEFINKQIDPKTYYHLYLLEKKEIEIQYKKDDLNIPHITFEDIKSTHIPYLYWRIHMYKRLFLYDSLDKEKVKNLYKITYLIMKAILILNNYLPKNYEETFKLYSAKFNIDYFDYKKFISDYLNDNLEYLEIIDYAKNFLLSITN